MHRILAVSRGTRSFVCFLLACALGIARGDGRDTLEAVDAPPPGFKVAFLGDQGLGPASEAVLRLVRDEGADLLVHLGDFDYQYNPAAWEDQTNRILGSGFPQVALVGNHDLPNWAGPGGYAQFISERMRRMGLEVSGEAGVRCSFRYRGIFFVLTAPGLMPGDHAGYIREALAADTSIWRISAWHMNQSDMQVGGKPDEVGWGVYEESRLGGAVIATAHEHSYSRTHLLDNMRAKRVVSRSDVLRIRKGRTFAFVSGLGGSDVRPQYKTGPWWAKAYTATQGAVPGALFAAFHVDEDPRKARFVFKAVDGTVADSFEVFSDPPEPPRPPGFSEPLDGHRLVLDPKILGLVPGGRFELYDAAGRSVADVAPARGPVTLTLRQSGLLILRYQGLQGLALRKIVILP